MDIRLRKVRMNAKISQYYMRFDQPLFSLLRNLIILKVLLHYQAATFTNVTIASLDSNER